MNEDNTPQEPATETPKPEVEAVASAPITTNEEPPVTEQVSADPPKTSGLRVLADW